MEYGKKDWQRSEGQLKSFGRESGEKEKHLSAYRPSDRENTWERKPHEMMTMESSYGGISLGASRNRRLTMVVHEKRSARGPALKRDNQEVEGNRTAAISQLRGIFRTNSHSRQDSAFAYQEELEETPFRMLERIQEMLDENSQKSGEKVLPFLNRREDQAARKKIGEELRKSQEKGDRRGYALWNQRREAFEQEQTEKAQMRRRFYRELSFTREKSRRLMREEALGLPQLFEAIQESMDISGEEPPKEEEKPEGTSQ